MNHKQADIDVLVVGGGMLGISLAYHLGLHKLRCLVCERESGPAHHSSGKNAGMFRQLYRHPQLTQWAIDSRRTWPLELKRLSFRTTGSYILGRNAPDHHTELFEERNVSVAGKSVSAVYTATDGLLDPGTFVGNLYQEIDRRFVDCIFRTMVTAITPHDTNWITTLSSGQQVRSRWVVNAAGAWLNSILPDIPQCSVKVQPFVRHLFITTGWPEHYMPEQHCGFYWDEVHEWYLRLWTETQRLVSICDMTPSDPDRFVATTNPLEQVSEKLLAVLGTTADNVCVTRNWHCFRTYTEDQLPVWGEDSRFARLFWLGGFGGFGMSTGFAAAGDAARYIAQGIKTEIFDFSPLRVQRFQRDTSVHEHP